MEIIIVPYGRVAARECERPARELGGFFGLAVSVTDARRVPSGARDSSRGQFASRIFLEDLGPAGDDLLLGLTDVDLFMPRLSFIFGRADRARGAALVSSCRLRPEYYGEGADGELHNARLVKEAVHELGHLVGLDHCSTSRCVMRFSNTIADTDAKGPGMCEPCSRQLQQALRRLRDEPPARE